MTEDYKTHLVEEVRAGRMSRRELIRRGTVFGVSFTVLGSMLAACGDDPTQQDGSSTTAVGPSEEGAFRKGGTLRAGNIQPVGDLEPLTMNDGGTVFAVQTSCEYLCFPEPNLELRPVLATEWKPARTPRQWTFTLREGVTFHNGQALTADDVVASFDRYTDPEGTSSALSSFAGILSKGNIEKVDARTVTFHLDRAYADFPYLVSALNYGTPILPANYEPGDFRKGGVGTGAYKLEKYTSKRSARYVRNTDYWGDAPHLDAIEVSFYAEAAPMVLAMQGGDSDFIPGLSYRDSRTLTGKQDITVYENPSSSYRPVHMRVDRAPFDDKRVRQALGHAVNREALIRSLLGGTGQMGNDHAFAPTFPVSPQDEVPQRSFDPEKAKQLLADAGHGDGLRIKLTTLEYEDIPQLAVLLKDQFRQSGVNLDVDIQTSEAYFGTGDNQPWLEVPMGIVYWASRGTPSQLIAPAYLSEGVWNSAHWKNRRFDQLVADLDAEVDEGRRKDLARQAAALMQDETPALIPYWLKEFRAVKKGVQGIAPGPNVVWDPSTAGFAA